VSAAAELARAAHGYLPGRAPGRSGRGPGDRGSVTAEMAVAVPALVVLLAAALTAVSAVTAQMRCVDAARESARAAARGDGDPAAVGRRVAPPGATVTVAAHGDSVRAVVTAAVRPVGRWLPAPVVSATAVAAHERNGAP
jgi:hypothetical protein